jgi:hypothetical protein
VQRKHRETELLKDSIKLCKGCIEQGEHQEGEKNLFSKKYFELSYLKSQRCKECVGV